MTETSLWEEWFKEMTCFVLLRRAIWKWLCWQLSAFLPTLLLLPSNFSVHNCSAHQKRHCNENTFPFCSIFAQNNFIRCFMKRSEFSIAVCLHAPLWKQQGQREIQWLSGEAEKRNNNDNCKLLSQNSLKVTGGNFHISAEMKLSFPWAFLVSCNIDKKVMLNLGVSAKHSELMHDRNLKVHRKVRFKEASHTSMSTDMHPVTVTVFLVNDWMSLSKTFQEATY